MPIAAEAAIQSSALRSVGLKTSGLRQGCGARGGMRPLMHAERAKRGRGALSSAHIVALGLWAVVDGRRVAVMVRRVGAVQVLRRWIPERGDAEVPEPPPAIARASAYAVGFDAGW